MALRAPERPNANGGNGHEPQSDWRALNRMDKRSLSERDICIKFITPRPAQRGWHEMLQIHEDLNSTNGRISVRRKLVTRWKADDILCSGPQIPNALIEAQDNNYSVGDGIQQAPDSLGCSRCEGRSCHQHPLDRVE
jgi:hypothetical protein